MNIEEIKKWITKANPNESIIYYTGHLAEERDKLEIRKMADAFWIAAQQKKIDLFQKKIKEIFWNFQNKLSKRSVYYEIIIKKLGIILCLMGFHFGIV